MGTFHYVFVKTHRTCTTQNSKPFFLPLELLAIIDIFTVSFKKCHVVDPGYNQGLCSTFSYYVSLACLSQNRTFAFLHPHQTMTLVEELQKSLSHRCRKQTSSCQWEGGREAIQGLGRGKYKLLRVRQATRMYCTTWRIWQILYHNCKQSVIFKNCT